MGQRPHGRPHRGRETEGNAYYSFTNTLTYEFNLTKLVRSDPIIKSAQFILVFPNLNDDIFISVMVLKNMQRHETGKSSITNT